MEDQSNEIITAHGRLHLEAELENLVDVVRPRLARRIHQAKECGDRPEGGAFDDAKNELGFVEGRIQYLHSVLAHAKIVDAHDPSVVSPGGFAEVDDPDGKRQVLNIVDPAEVAPLRGKISNQSPVAQALLGKCPSDKVHVQAPTCTIKFLIKKVW